MGLSVCMIARDEEAHIRPALASVAAVADQVIVVDTGSSDGTPVIAREMGAQVYHRPWRGDFSDARNASLRYARHRWILVLDADEELDPSSIPSLRKILAGQAVPSLGYRVVIDSATDDGQHAQGEVLRIFRNHKGIRYVGRVHEQPSPEIFVTSADIPQSGVRLFHYGYLQEEVSRKRKRERNLTLLEESIRESGDPSSYLTYQLAKEYALAGQFARAKDLFESILNRTDRIHHPAVVRGLANCYERLGQNNEELALLDRWIAVYPDYTDLRYLRAGTYARMGQPLKAAAELVSCLVQGEAPARYEHTVGTGSFLAMEALAKVNRLLGQEEEARRLETIAGELRRHQAA